MLLLIALFHFDRGGRGEASVHYGAWRERRGVPIARHDHRSTTRCAGRPANHGTLSATEDRAENRAAYSSASDLARAFRTWRFTLSVDWFGSQRDLTSIGENQRVESHTETRGLFDLSTALDEVPRHEYGAVFDAQQLAVRT